MQLEFSGCILSKFYIKPQLRRAPCKDLARCILSKFYIKPQHLLLKKETLLVVSYRNSTSNHNCHRGQYSRLGLYLIEILHQTTTFRTATSIDNSCILSKFYIKPQRVEQSITMAVSCILSKFYIKPQLARIRSYSAIVVSYRNSTSNHNLKMDALILAKLYLIEILHQTTTRCSRTSPDESLYLIEILHQTTTDGAHCGGDVVLYLIEILHQTTTVVLLPRL